MLTSFFRILAPFLPLISESAFKTLTNKNSVHLEDWPAEDYFLEERDLIKKMDFVRKIVSVGLSIRKINNLRVRLPLKSVSIISSDFDIEWLNEYENLIKEEINSKAIIYSKQEYSPGGYQLKLNPRLLGPKLGHDVQKCINAAREGRWTQNNDGKVEVENYILEQDEYSLEPTSDEDKGIQKVSGFNVFIKLDLNITSDLESEGYARDLVRLIQNIRRDINLEVTDNIKVIIISSKRLRESFMANCDYISDQILAESLDFNDDLNNRKDLFEGKISGEKIKLLVEKYPKNVSILGCMI